MAILLLLRTIIVITCLRVIFLSFVVLVIYLDENIYNRPREGKREAGGAPSGCMEWKWMMDGRLNAEVAGAAVPMTASPKYR